MPFQYQQFDSGPWVRTAAELMLRPAEIQARAAEQIAAAQGRAAEIGGQAWAGAVQNIGQTIGQIPQQIAQQKRVAQQDELTGMKISEEKRAIEARNVFSKIIKDTPQLDEDGVSLYDIPTVAKQLAAAGMDPGDAVKHLGGINDAFRAEKAAKLALVKRGAEGIISSGNDPTLASHFLDQLEKNGTYSKEQIGQFRQFIAADPGNVAKLTSMLVGPQKMERGAPGSVAVNPLTGIPVAGSAVPDPKGDAATAHATAQQAEIARHNLETERIATLTAGRTEAAQKETERHNKAIEGIDYAKLKQATADKTELTPEGLDAAAMMFAKTGQLPALGMGDKTTRKAIINRAAVMVPGLDVASAKADFGANTASLKNVTGTLDTLTAFENTSGKNLDQFLALADKIPDTGVPWLNTPVRLLNDKMVGSENQAAANAARTVALREIARVTNDPKLSGVLSDSARQEVAALSAADATFGQIKKVAKVLKQDMANVHSSLSDQRDAIAGRIKLGSAPAAPVTVTSPGGKAYTFKTQAEADAAVAKAKDAGLWK